MISHKKQLSVRIQILILTVLILIPVLFLIFYLNIKTYNEAKEDEILKLKSINKIVALENTQTIEGVRQLLITLSISPEIKMPYSECSTYLLKLLNKYQRYGNFGVADLNGNVLCSAIPFPNQINMSDRYFFQETLKNKDFAIGEYAISRVTNKASINFGYPASNEKLVVYATLNLDWLNEFVSNLNLNSEYESIVLDKNGVIIANSINQEKWIGQLFPDSNLITKLQSNDVIIEAKDLNGADRLYVITPIGDIKSNLYAAIGIPKLTIFQNPEKNLYNNLVIFMFITTMSILFGYFAGNKLIFNILKAMDEVEKLKRDFVSLASHQIRTPVTAIKWFTEILLSKSAGKLTKKQETILKDTHLSAKRMIELIGNILSITKLENGKINLEKTEVNLNQMTIDILKIVNNEFKNKNIKYNFVYHIKQYKLKADEKLIFQAIYNLIHNAYKYSSKNSLIKINISSTNSDLIIKISDNGIGIPISERENIFVKFSRATNAKMVDTEGAGLGLYLSKLIINAHGGDIKLGNQKTGTLVLVSIPIT